jgi:hypothetical protein
VERRPEEIGRSGDGAAAALPATVGARGLPPLATFFLDCLPYGWKTGSIRLGSSGRSLTKTRPMCTAQSFNEPIQSNSTLLYA